MMPAQTPSWTYPPVRNPAGQERRCAAARASVSLSCRTPPPRAKSQASFTPHPHSAGLKDKVWRGRLGIESVHRTLSQPAQLALRYDTRLRRNQITQTIRRIIDANTVLIGVHFHHVLKPIRIVLQRGQTLNQATTPLVNEQPRQEGPCPPSDMIRRGIHNRGQCRQPRPARITDNHTRKHESPVLADAPVHLMAAIAALTN
jgi:hypothetical protein